MRRDVFVVIVAQKYAGKGLLKLKERFFSAFGGIRSPENSLSAGGTT